MKTFLFTLAVLVTLVSPHASRHPMANGAPPPAACASRRCDEVVPREGQLLLVRRLRLGKPVEFDDGLGINGGICYPLYDGGRLLAWLDSYHQAGGRLFVRRCVEEFSIKDLAPGSKGGAVADAFDELRLEGDGRQPKFVQLDPPRWSEFANPSFCNRYLAYWGMEFRKNEPVKVFAVVFDLSAGQVLRQELLGSLQLESDSRSFFARPRWGAADKSVTFDPGPRGGTHVADFRLKPITVRLK
jgi:hypothetical protein